MWKRGSQSIASRELQVASPRISPRQRGGSLAREDQGRQFVPLFHALRRRAPQQPAQHTAAQGIGCGRRFEVAVIARRFGADNEASVIALGGCHRQAPAHVRYVEQTTPQGQDHTRAAIRKRARLRKPAAGCKNVGRIRPR